MYQQYVDGDDSYLSIEQDKDPFFDPPQDYLIGSSNAFLQSLSYGLDFDDKLTITDYKVCLSRRYYRINGRPVVCRIYY